MHMEAASVLQQPQGDKGEPEGLEKRLLDKGVRPFSVQALREDEVVNKLVYAALGIAYKDKDEEIIPRMLPDDLDSLEYRLINTLYKLSRDAPPVVALVAPKTRSTFRRTCASSMPRWGVRCRRRRTRMKPWSACYASKNTMCDGWSWHHMPVSRPGRPLCCVVNPQKSLRAAALGVKSRVV